MLTTVTNWQWVSKDGVRSLHVSCRGCHEKRRGCVCWCVDIFFLERVGHLAALLGTPTTAEGSKRRLDQAKWQAGPGFLWRSISIPFEMVIVVVLHRVMLV